MYRAQTPVGKKMERRGEIVSQYITPWTLLAIVLALISLSGCYSITVQPSVPGVAAPLVAPHPATASCDISCFQSWWIFSRQISQGSLTMDYTQYPAGITESQTAELINLDIRLRAAARRMMRGKECEGIRIGCSFDGLGEIEFTITPQPGENELITPVPVGVFSGGEMGVKPVSDIRQGKVLEVLLAAWLRDSTSMKAEEPQGGKNKNEKLKKGRKR